MPGNCLDIPMGRMEGMALHLWGSDPEPPWINASNRLGLAGGGGKHLLWAAVIDVTQFK